MVKVFVVVDFELVRDWMFGIFLCYGIEMFIIDDFW